ncbi:hypothetical protein C1I98_29350 [Spongiactinospora gelatinilytica]|uniref:Aminoglycoside phosphotransferase domain-containing protein n=1 Tax=Spongiactinospora gelatinilytica TaxID=2666298 RepID=A0A2W2G657_9ACTN|nr:hypothetical protein [Spongiactinospora gelatinilytica]PZG32448.1 hypothetical protein C1I98_29350 [Spongiactinospora gelatinilytica]
MPDPSADPIALITAWAGGPVTITEIEGGRGHRVARVEAGGGRRWLLRVLDPGVAAAGLGLEPETEIANTRQAAVSGVGPQVVHRLAGLPALLLEDIEGRALDAAAVREPDLIPGIARACRRLHAGPAFANDFSIFAELEGLLGLCRRRGLPVPDGHADRLPAVADIERALAHWPLPAVPCHNGLLPQTLIAADGGEVRITDYRLSGNHDPAFDLGDVAAEADYPADLVPMLAGAYFGGPDRRLFARVALYRIVSDLVCALRSAVRHGLLVGPADPRAGERTRRAVRHLDDPAFGRLIDDARGLPSF